MTDNERIVAPAAGAVAAPGHEEALAELAAENERLRRALRLAVCRTTEFDECNECPRNKPECDCCQREARTHNVMADCWCEYYIACAAEAARANAGDAE